MVALLAEGVDMKFDTGNNAGLCDPVALLAEGVGIEIKSRTRSGTPALVALLAEGVDRNPKTDALVTAPGVALLAEGVARKFSWHGRLSVQLWSPSSRRAWIEISNRIMHCLAQYSRPPRGGRG